MRIECILFFTLFASSVGYGQQLIRETVREYSAPVQYSPTIVYRTMPVYSPPVVYAAPVVYSAAFTSTPFTFTSAYSAPVPVARYRVGFGFREDVVYSNGAVVRYRR